MQVLAGDIGGTKTLLAVCEAGPVPGGDGALSIEVLASSRYDSRKFSGLGEICRLFAEEVRRPMPRFAGFGVAGPVANGRPRASHPTARRGAAQSGPRSANGVKSSCHAIAAPPPAPNDFVHFPGRLQGT